MTVEVTQEGVEAIDLIMPVMDQAFDPAFGEAWNREQCHGALMLTGCVLLVARRGGDVAGFAIARTVLDETELMLIATAPPHQRHGVGLALLESLLAHVRQVNAKTIYVEMRHDNPAMAFYVNSAFTVIGERRNYYRRSDGSFADALTLRHRLD